jgi:hypothetical protein
VRKTREGGYRVGYGKQHIGLRAAGKQEAHRVGKRKWREKYGTILVPNVK